MLATCSTSGAFWDFELALSDGRYSTGQEVHARGRDSSDIRAFTAAVYVADRTRSRTGNNYCVPSDATNAHLAAVAYQYMEDNPAKLSQRAVHLVREAFHAAYPCLADPR